jgi:hypothetical protein
MLHACVERFDVMCVRGNILGWEEEVNAAKAKEWKQSKLTPLLLLDQGAKQELER